MIKNFIVSNYARINDIVCVFSVVVVLIYSAVMWYVAGPVAAVIALIAGALSLVVWFGLIYIILDIHKAVKELKATIDMQDKVE